VSEERRGRVLEEERPPEEAVAGERGPRFPPILYPLAALVFGGVLVWSFSRLLLAASPVSLGPLELDGRDVAVAIAIFMALNILIGAALIAYGARVRGRPASLPFLAGAAVAVVVAGAVAAFAVGDVGPEGALGEEEQAAGGPAQELALVARGIAFDRTELTVAAGSTVRLTLDNRDQGVPHNFALYTDESATESIFVGEIFPGVGVRTYTFRAPEPGTYFFRCDVHPTQMTGTLTVTEGPPAAEGAGAPGGPVTVTARGIAFDTRTITVSPGRVTIRFDNQDANIPHNIAVYTDESATRSLFVGEVFPGPAVREYTFEVPEPGTYFFRCDVHPTQMTGTFVVRG
jgi:plastocyanin